MDHLKGSVLLMDLQSTTWRLITHGVSEPGLAWVWTDFDSKKPRIVLQDLVPDLLPIFNPSLEVNWISRISKMHDMTYSQHANLSERLAIFRKSDENVPAV